MSPWAAFALVALGLVGAVATAYWHLGGPATGIAVGAATAGLAAMQAHLHVVTRRDYTELRRSMRPPPSLVDEDERNAR